MIALVYLIVNTSKCCVDISVGSSDGMLSAGHVERHHTRDDTTRHTTRHTAPQHHNITHHTTVTGRK